MKNLLLLLLFFPILAFGQDEKPKNWTIRGYVKDLQSVFMLTPDIPGFDTTIVNQQNQIHNRLNFKWYISPSFSFKMDLRNRLFWGDELNEVFLENLDQANDYFDLSYGATNNNGLALHTMIDRLYFEYIKGKFEVRLGRQRINWGISTIWNPNDIFNAFNFTDFDYEERPGSDALRLRYYTGVASSIELAVKAADSWETAVAAALVKLNKWDYDFQVLTGIANKELALGGGWAGGIKGLGFKGEFTYFQPFEEGVDPSFAATFGLDYLTANSIFLSGGFLFNSNGSLEDNILSLFSFELSAKNLYPYRYSLVTSANYPITPLMTAGFSAIYSPSKAHALFLTPTFNYSISTNWDFDLIAQLAFNQSDGYTSPIQGLFMRFKYSY